MTHDNESSDAAAHALDALSASERAAQEQRMTEDADERETTRVYHETASRLASMSEPAAPPAELKDRLMGMLDSVPQDVPEHTEEAADGPQRTARPGAHERARRRWFQRPATIAIAAVAASVLIFAGGTILGTTITGGTDENPPGIAQPDNSRLASIIAAPDAEHHDLSGDGLSGTLVWSPSLKLSAVVFDDLPETPEGKTFEAWYIDDDGPSPAGTFASQQQSATVHVLDGTFTPGDTIGVTIEPDGGSPEPTSDPIVAIETS